ncbi:hypothetical protein PENSPDRAFT_656686 [Peniophora sp. CONT]|nr:hypothetical protein PENSPDRAFT_656686 [Peniophora sp. CONT]
MQDVTVSTKLEERARVLPASVRVPPAAATTLLSTPTVSFHPRQQMNTHIPASQFWAAQVQARLAGLHRDEIWATGTMRQREELATRLLDEAEALEELVGLVKRHANACRPVFALPTEVLGHIVGLVANERPPSWTLRELKRVKSSVDPGWLSLQLVCKHWRDVCLATNDLRLAQLQCPTAQWPSISVGLEGRNDYREFYLSPSLAACIRVLKLRGLSHLNMQDVLEFLRQTPSLRILVCDSCQWDIEHIPSTPTTVYLNRLKALVLSDQIDDDYQDALCDVLSCLRFSATETSLHLGLHLDTGASVANIVALDDSICLAAGYIVHPDASLCVHFGKDAIYMANMPSFDRQAFFTLLRNHDLSFWQVSIAQAEPPHDRPMVDLSTALHSINNEMRDIDGARRTELLSIYVDEYSLYLDPNEQGIFALFGLFSNIRILHIAGTILFSYADDPNGVEVTTTLSAILRFLSGGTELPILRLEQLWLCPVHLVDEPRALSLLYDLLRNRIARPSSVIHTIHVDIPRPSSSGDDHEISFAVAFESLVPNFTWRSAA